MRWRRRRSSSRPQKTWKRHCYPQREEALPRPALPAYVLLDTQAFLSARPWPRLWTSPPSSARYGAPSPPTVLPSQMPPPPPHPMPLAQPCMASALPRAAFMQQSRKKRTLTGATPASRFHFTRRADVRSCARPFSGRLTTSPRRVKPPGLGPCAALLYPCQLHAKNVRVGAR